MAIGTKEYMTRLGREVLEYFYPTKGSYALKVDPSSYLIKLPDGQFYFQQFLDGLTSEAMKKMTEISDTWGVPVKFFDGKLTFTPNKLPDTHTANNSYIAPEYWDLSREVLNKSFNDVPSESQVKIGAGIIADFISARDRARHNLGL